MTAGHEYVDRADDRHRFNALFTSDSHPIEINHDLSFPTNIRPKFALIIPLFLIDSQTNKAIDNEILRNYAMISS
jgi:hypothetical protein